MTEASLSAVQSRMARAGLEWSLAVAAARSGLHCNTISNFERRTFRGAPESLAKLQAAYEAAGITFFAAGRGLAFVSQENLDWLGDVQ